MWLGLLVVVAVLCAAGAGFGGYTVSNNKAKKDKTALSNKIATLQQNTHELPADAVKVSECIPNMGAHYLPKGADSTYGPFMMVNKDGRVIGIEYMVSQDMYIPIPKTEPPVELIEKNSPMYGWGYDHTELSHLPKGHEGFLKNHTDVHLYTVTPDQQKNACLATGSQHPM